MTLAKRLNEELDHQEWGTRRLVKEMKEADPEWKGKGVSHARVKAFRDGTDQPTTIVGPVSRSSARSEPQLVGVR